MALSITPRLIIAAAEQRGWTARIINETFGLYRLNLPDGRFFYLRGITSIKTSAVNMFIADNKDILSELAAELGVRVPDSERYQGDAQAARAFLRKHGTIVVKPTNQSHGNGVTVDVTAATQLDRTIAYAQQYSKSILLQQQIMGDDYRVLMIGGTLAAAAIREPAFVIGDGSSTIAQLIAAENASPRRGEGYGSMLTRIDPEVAERYLGDALGQVPVNGQKRRVVGTANIGKGGVSIDVTDTISSQLVTYSETIVSHLGIGVCGVDFLVDPAGVPYLIEINSGPSLGLHEYPYQGNKRGTPELFLDWLTAA